MPFDLLNNLDVIDGDRVRLERLSMSHHQGLCQSGLDDELWRFTISNVRTQVEMTNFITDALHQHEVGSAVPFAIVDRTSGRVAGSTRFGNIDRANRRVEIGWTWVGREWQRTVVNTETKFLLLQYAFETLECVRVEFKADALNQKSRKALMRIGATEEGVLRRHMVTHDGRFRDTVYYSILDSDWTTVGPRLQEMMAQPTKPGQ